jgi:hypothetical protein
LLLKFVRKLHMGKSLREKSRRKHVMKEGYAFRTQIILLVIILCASRAAAFDKSSFTTFALGPTGVAVEQPNTLLIAVPLNNNSRTVALNISIKALELDSASLLTPIPILIPRIDSGGTAIVEASFDSSHLASGKQYPLILFGSYCTDSDRHDEVKDKHKHGQHCHDRNHKFIVKSVAMLPPGAPGSAETGSAIAPSNSVSGATYPHQSPQIDKDVNGAAPPIPTASTVAGTPSPTNTLIMPAPFGDPADILFSLNTGVGFSSAGSGCSGDPLAVCAEPSGASGGGVVFVSANWVDGYSTDGGSTFTQLDPTTIFPNDAVGFCCDQIVQYAPSIDRFIWLLQGSGGYHLAMASPADIIQSGGTAWTYWNLTPELFGEPTSVSFDYPDLSVGDNDLYISWDGNGGFQVARISLAGIQGGSTITIDYTHPSDSPTSITWGDHLTQDTGNEIFWAGHNGNNTLRVFSLAEGSNTYFWRDVGISSWANNAPTSTTPDGRDWLAKNFNGPGGNSFPRNGIIGATRSGNQLWYAWSAGTDSNFQQPHIEMVTLDRSNNFSKIQQVQIWNNSYAFAYPSLATNACSGEVGLSFENGGNGNYENHAVGFWGDFVAYLTTGSNIGTDRFGDYVTIRQAPRTETNPGNLFDAFGFGVNSIPPPGTGTQTDVHYVLFGRPSTACEIIK